MPARSIERASTVCYGQVMQTRRAQKPITIRSDKVAAKLAVLTRDGRSQAQVIEEALDLLPVPASENNAESLLAARIARLDAILAQIDPDSVMSMAEFDAQTYDEHGLPR